MTINERFGELLRHKGISIKDAADLIGKSESYIRKILVPNQSFGLEPIKAILTSMPDVNIDWLISGEGRMLKTDLPKGNEAAIIVGAHAVNVPLVNQYAYGGYVNGYADMEYIDSLPTIPFIVDHEARGNYMAFEVRGDSMDDGTDEAYKEGDRLLCREIKSDLWVSAKLHHKKWDFVIVHKEGILIKRIADHDVTNHTIIIHSLNPEYPDRTIDLKDVRQIFNVIEMSRPRRR